jgi:succinoglycan biosynthesis protein ExoL
MICDHKVDPRLRRKLQWFKNDNWEIELFEEDRADFLSNDSGIGYVKRVDLNTLELSSYVNQIIYISGTKIFLRHFMLFRKLRKQNTVLIEVPDLPYRSKSLLKSMLQKIVFVSMIKLLADKLVVTSPAFLDYLDKSKPFLLDENFPSLDIAKSIYNIKRNEGLVISYIGVIRYFEQLELVIKYVLETERDVKLNIYGGPLDRFNLILRKFGNMIESSGKIIYHGEFKYEESIADIYTNSTFVYSVYDADQLNVRLALPNKVYEACLAKKWFLCAQNTYLGKYVAEEGIGISLPYKLTDYEKFRAQLDSFIDSINGGRVFPEEASLRLMEKIKVAEASFIKFVN